MKKASILIFFLIFLFSACENSINNGNIQEKLQGVRGYSATADITVKGNKGTSFYKVKQYCIYPNKLRIETLEPDFLKGKVITKADDKWNIYHPLIKESISVTKLMEDDEIILMGVFQRDLFTNSNLKISKTKYQGMDCYEIKSPLPKGNRYRSTAVLYISEEKEIPIGMIIYDSNGNVAIEIKYTDFTFNHNFQDTLFNIKS